MAVHKIVLFYAFTPLADPRAVQLWQRALGERWNLTGRVIVAEHGINATLGGTVEDLKQYVKTTRQYPGFEGIDVKWSDGTGRDFPRLSVKVRPEASWRSASPTRSWSTSTASWGAGPG